MLVKHSVGQALSAGGAELLVLLFVGNEVFTAVALHLKLVAVHLVDRLQQLLEVLDADAEAHIVGIGELSHGDCCHLAGLVEDGAARVAGVDGRIDLHIVASVHQLLGRRDGALGDSERHAVGIAGHLHLVTIGECVVGGERQLGQVAEVVVHGQQSQVDGGVDHHNLGKVSNLVVVVDGDLVEAFDHMVVGHKQVERLEVEATARAARVFHLKHSFEYIGIKHRFLI